MLLTQLIYVSQASESMSQQALASLVRLSARNNARLDVTGVLLVYGRSMMQLLEGDQPVVEALFSKIRSDKRHSDVSKLLQKTVRRRLYPEWGMGLSDLQARQNLDLGRLNRLLSDLQANCETADFSVEARVLVSDFAQQAGTALSR